MAGVFATACVAGLLELFLSLGRLSPADKERLKNSEDLAFKKFLTSFGKNYKQDDMYELHKKEFLLTR